MPYLFIGAEYAHLKMEAVACSVRETYVKPVKTKKNWTNFGH